MIRRQDQHGFNLIELLVALGILGVVGVSILMGLGTAFRGTGIQDEQVTGANLATVYLENIKNCAYADTYPNAGCLLTNIAIPSGYSAVIATECSTDASTWQPCAGQNLQKITVSVSRPNKPVLTISTYRAKR